MPAKTFQRTALFLCKCGTNIDSVIEIEVLKKHYSRRANLVVVDDAHFCVEQGLNLIRDTIRKEKIERVVVAACSPRLHGELLNKTVEEAGLNHGYLSIANIREQCSWVHWDNPAAATAKAQIMIDAALQAVQYAVPIHNIKIPVTKRVMVIGAGIAGITTALNLADAGHEVVLIEKSGFLGGHMAKWDKLFPVLDCSLCILGPLMTEVDTHPKIRILTLSEVKDIRGNPGSYEVTILQRPRYVDLESCNGCNKCLEICPVEVASEYDYGLSIRTAVVRPYPNSVPLAPYIDMDECVGCQSCVGVCEKESIRFDDTEQTHTFKVGAIVVATGFQPFNPKNLAEFGYERYPDVITAPELERLLNPNGPSAGHVICPSTGKQPSKVAFVQCVGSRDFRINRPYCSRVCCTYAVKEAVQLRLAQPDTDVYIFYTDMRTFGKGFEELYERAAREHGVTFIRGRVAEIEEDPQSKQLLIRTEDTELCNPMELPADLVVLSVGMDPTPTNANLANLLNVPLDENHFFLEKHPKLDPTGTYSAGIILAGTAQGPKDIADTVAHAGLAAAQAASLLNRRNLALDIHAPILDATLCEGCRLCEKTCDADAITFSKEKKPVIDELACTGCGACVAACPTGALDLPGFTRNQLAAVVQAAIKDNPLHPIIIGFLCHWCAYAAADAAGISRLRYPPQFIPIRIPCSGRLDPLLILEAFSQGADGVAILGCHEQDCHHRTGIIKAKARFEKLLPVLRKTGIDQSRLLFGSTAASEGRHLADLVTNFTKHIAKLGPLGSELAIPARSK
jgi:heterodisulfide reductase subunit A